jgi:hypothetical protein
MGDIPVPVPIESRIGVLVGHGLRIQGASGSEEDSSRKKAQKAQKRNECS